MKSIICILFVYGDILILQNEYGMDVKMLHADSIIKQEFVIETDTILIQLTGLNIIQNKKKKTLIKTHIFRLCIAWNLTMCKLYLVLVQSLQLWSLFLFVVDHNLELPKKLSGIYLQPDYWMSKFTNSKEKQFTAYATFKTKSHILVRMFALWLLIAFPEYKWVKGNSTICPFNSFYILQNLQLLPCFFSFSCRGHKRQI